VDDRHPTYLTNLKKETMEVVLFGGGVAGSPARSLAAFFRRRLFGASCFLSLSFFPAFCVSVNAGL
jgi:hypothetical protein